MPDDQDFDQAAIWRIELPADFDLRDGPILRFDYVGDVARVVLDGNLLTDNFYSGKVFEVGLRRHVPAILDGELNIQVLPLREDAPIYMANEARPEFGQSEGIAVLRCVELIPRPTIQLTAP